MFFVLPGMAIISIYILAAVLPAVFLLRYIYKHDTVEKEPPGLLLSLLLMGVLAALASIVLEVIGQKILDANISQDDPYYNIILAFVVVAAVEEGTKFFFLKLRTWNNPNFNYRFDGIVYAVFVSLGFAAFENIKYVFNFGLSVALPRAILAVPGHMGFAVFMGLFYGRARLFADIGKRGAKNANLIAGYLMAVLLHGFYDACAMIGNVLATALFVVFVIVMYIVVIAIIKRESRTDMRV
ncbi:MAG: PrsW family glutamic-type intramembrane protease [Clostridia bacterium]|nr:PrsW family glutamic-type intramembrane protease [Clostridia bacterium]